MRGGKKDNGKNSADRNCRIRKQKSIEIHQGKSVQLTLTLKG